MVSAPEILPSVAGWRVQTRLRKARTEKRLKRQDVAKSLDWSVSKLLRIENGDVKLSTTDLRALTDLYQLGEADTSELVDLVRISRRSSVASEFRDVMTREFNQWVDFELSAQVIRQFEPKLVPGILQNNGYAMSIVTAYTESKDEVVIERKVQARLKRAEYLLRDDGPEMFFIIDEAALRRGVGNETGKPDFSVMIRLLESLKRLNTVGRTRNGDTDFGGLNPKVSIQVMPLSFGAYPALLGPFEILEFEPTEDYMLYRETPVGDFVNQNPGKDITYFLDNFETMEEQATPAEETNNFIDRILEDIGRRTAA